MKKVEILIGSPRKKGNTSFLANQLGDRLIAEGFDVNFSFLQEMAIHACTDCRGCKRGELNCIVQDDLQLLYPKLEAADLIVFGTPIYWYTPSAQMKALLDRLRPYYGSQRLKGKKAASILVAGSGDRDCQLTMQMFGRMFDALGLENLGNVNSESFDIGDAKKDFAAIDQVKQLANKILSA